MATVPYSGSPQVSPNYQPLGRDTVEATPAAFGVNVAQAVEGLGKTAEGVGNEIFARGLAMQDLYNHSQSLEADAKYSEAAGQIYEKMKAKAGGDAVDYFASGDYTKELHDARANVRSTLDNPMAQKMFDSSTLSTLTRTNLYGASYSGEQNRKYALGASNAKIDALSQQTMLNPADEDRFQDNLQDTEDEIRAQGPLQGDSPEVTEEKITKATSNLWANRIIGLTKTQPVTAAKMLEQAVKDGGVRGEDIAKLTAITQQATHTVGARMISQQVATGASGRWGAGTVDINQAASAIRQIESGGNYNSIGVQTAHGRALGAYQVMEEFLPDYLAKAGLPAMTPKEFLANHSAQDQVFAANFGANMKATGSANDAASMWLTGKPLAQAGNVKDALGTDAKAYVARFNAALAQGAPLTAKVAMGQKMAAEQVPEDPLFPDTVRDRIETDYNKQKAIQRDDDFQNRQVIETALMGGQDGKLPTSVEELTSDPKAEQAWQNLVTQSPAVARRYMSVLAKNAKGDHNWTDASLRQYQQFKGQAETNPAEFIDEDVISTDLPNSAKRELINLQGRKKTQAEGDPRVARALGILSPDMQAAGIDKKDKETYYQFTGALADQLEQFAQDNKKPPSVEDVKTIGSRLMQSQSTPGWLWGTNQTPTWQVPVPKDEAEKIKGDPTWGKLGVTPTDQQVQRIYTRKLYQDLYGGTPKAQASGVPVPNAPSVPISR